MKRRYKYYMSIHRNQIKKDLTRLTELNDKFHLSDDEYWHYTMLVENIALECKLFNMRFKTNISCKTFINLFC